MLDILTFISGLITGMVLILVYATFGEKITDTLYQGWDMLVNELRPKPFAYVVIMG